MILKPLLRKLQPALWTPALLYSSGEQGAWYDPSDLPTLYQDAAGTTPVTADGDPVGLMLDKSGNGNHATQSVAAARPVYQRGDSRGVVNLLKWSEAFDNAVWAKFRVSVSTNATLSPFGEMTAERVTETVDFNSHVLRVEPISVVTNQTYTLSVYAKQLNNNYVRVRFNTFNGNRGAYFNLNTGDIGSVEAECTASITDAGSGWYRLTITTNMSSGAGFPGVDIRMSQSGNDDAYTGNPANGVDLWGAQLDLGSTATTYQRNDSHLGGVATGASTDLHWLANDKVDDKLDATLPAMPSATVARATADGVTLTHPNNIPAGTYTLQHVGSQGFDYGRVIVNRELTATEQASTIAYLEGKS